MDNNLSKQDWKLFRSLLPGWQERYMERLCKEYVELLNSDKNASEKFWTLYKRINDDRRSPGVLVQLRMQDIEDILANLIIEGIIDKEEMKNFSEPLRNKAKHLAEYFGKDSDKPDM